MWYSGWRRDQPANSPRRYPRSDRGGCRCRRRRQPTRRPDRTSAPRARSCRVEWGRLKPAQYTLVVLTHRTEDQPDPSAGFLFVDGFDAALMKARELAGDGGVLSVVAPTGSAKGLAAGGVDDTL